MLYCRCNFFLFLSLFNHIVYRLTHTKYEKVCNPYVSAGPIDALNDVSNDTTDSTTPETFDNFFGADTQTQKSYA